MTVTDVLAQVEDSRFVSVVRLNGKLVSSPKFDTTKVPENAVVRLLPLVAGG
ncbi:MAG: MoaD/ThiS family protein [Desulfobacterales bacterium]|nr:MoaD/ThiS family protein [Desulfobacterales bacterium]